MFSHVEFPDKFQAGKIIDGINQETRCPLRFITQGQNTRSILSFWAQYFSPFFVNVAILRFISSHRTSNLRLLIYLKQLFCMWKMKFFSRFCTRKLTNCGSHRHSRGINIEVMFLLNCSTDSKRKTSKAGMAIVSFIIVP